MRKLLTALLVLACIAMLIITSLPDSGKTTEKLSQEAHVEASTTPPSVTPTLTAQLKPENEKSFFPNEESFLKYLEQTALDNGYTAVKYEDFCKTGLYCLQETFPTDELKYSDNVYYRIDEREPEHQFYTQILYSYTLKLAIFSEKEIPVEPFSEKELGINTIYEAITPTSIHAGWANYLFGYLLNSRHVNNGIFTSYVIRNSLYCVDDLGEQYCYYLTEKIQHGVEYDTDGNTIERYFPVPYWQKSDPLHIENNGEYEYEIYDDNTIRIINYLGNANELTIPSEINGISVREIGQHWVNNENIIDRKQIGAFAAHGMISVTIPEGIEIIEEHAFALCENLKIIHIPSSVTNIGKFAFEKCRSLTDLYFNGPAPRFGIGVFQDINPPNIHYPKDYKISWAYVLQNYPFKYPY